MSNLPKLRSRRPCWVDFSSEWAELRERFQEVQRVRMEVVLSGARLVKDIAQSRELMAHADFLLTLPYLRREASESACEGNLRRHCLDRNGSPERVANFCADAKCDTKDEQKYAAL